MSFIGSGYGFFAGGTSGSVVSVVDIKQYQVGAQGAPNPNTSVFIPNPTIDGNNVTVFVNGYGYLFLGTQFTFTTAGGEITQINLLGGLEFQQGEIYTMTGYTE